MKKGRLKTFCVINEAYEGKGIFKARRNMKFVTLMLASMIVPIVGNQGDDSGLPEAAASGSGNGGKRQILLIRRKHHPKQLKFIFSRANSCLSFPFCEHCLSSTPLRVHHGHKVALTF